MIKGQAGSCWFVLVVVGEMIQSDSFDSYLFHLIGLTKLLTEFPGFWHVPIYTLNVLFVYSQHFFRWLVSEFQPKLEVSFGVQTHHQQKKVLLIFHASKVANFRPLGDFMKRSLHLIR